MQFAKDNDGKKTYIHEAEAGVQYFCPSCGAPMIQRRGKINAPHFAHTKGSVCSDIWNYDDMSEWHISWQANYPLDDQEVVVSNSLGRHRADVLINNTVIEFQHSPMSVEEFQERNDFYTSCGYPVIWLFDARDAYLSNLTESVFDGTYKWKHPPKTLTGLDLNGNVQVYLHLRDNTQEDGGIVIRVTWCSNGDLSYFKSAPSECYSEAEFVQLSCTGSVEREVDMSGIKELTHDLFIICRKTSRESECCGCPINEIGFAPQIREYNRVSCDECAFCREIDSENRVVKCSGYFRNYLDSIKTVLEKHKTSEGVIYSFSYIAKDGTIQQDVKAEMPESPAASIIDLAKDYDAEVLIVHNIRTGNEYKITGNVSTMLSKYSRLFGYYWNSRYNCFMKSSSEIYYWAKPEWIVVWFLPKNYVYQPRP